ncbi:MAG: thioredoxin [Clostridiales bacterium]|nr:thioredoxin [Clostridiales bacterium]
MEVISGKDFEEKTKKGVVLVDFFANWCGPCRMMSPILESVAEELGDKVKIYKIDVDEDEKIARKFGIMSIPTMLIFANGELKDKHIGLWSKTETIEALSKLL